MKTRTTKSDLNTLAYNINIYGFCEYEIRVAQRNGYYAVEAFNKENNRLQYVLEAGMNCKECYMFLKGMRRAYIYMEVK